MNSDLLQKVGPDHFVIRGHNPKPYKNEEGQTVCPTDFCDIPKEVPSDCLFAILEARGEFQQTGEVQIDTDAQAVLRDLKEELATSNDIAEGLRVQLEETRAEIEKLKAGPTVEMVRGGPGVLDDVKPKNKGGRPRKVQPETAEAAQ